MGYSSLELGLGFTGLVLSTIGLVCGVFTIVLILSMNKKHSVQSQKHLQSLDFKGKAHIILPTLPTFLAFNSQKQDNVRLTSQNDANARGCFHLNGVTLLIFSLTCSQIVFDLSYVIISSALLAATNSKSRQNLIQAYNFMSSFGGISVALWITVICGVVSYIVSYNTPFNILQNYRFFLAGVMVPSFTFGIFFVSGSSAKHASIGAYAYNCVIGVSILINFVLCMNITRRLYLMGWRLTSAPGVNSVKNPTIVLASRLQYYPVWQVFTRVFVTYYDLEYGNSLNFNNINSKLQLTALGLLALSIPAAGIGFFLIFLATQPLAWKRFLTWFHCSPFCLPAADPLKDSVRNNEKGSSSTKFSSQLEKAEEARNFLYMDEDELDSEILKLSDPFKEFEASST